LKKLRHKSFQPEEEYVYLTYSIKNDKREESRVLLENYRQQLLDFALITGRYLRESPITAATESYCRRL
jgi:DNA repair protein RadC